MSELESVTQEAAAIDNARNEALALLAAEPPVEEKKAEPKSEPAPKADEKPTVEDPAKEDPPKEDAKENRIAVLMRAKKQAQRVRESAETEAQSRLKEIEAREAKLKERESALVGKLREKPIDALRELGLDPREFFERAVEDPKQLDPIRQLEAKFESKLEAIARRNQELEESLQRRQQEEQTAHRTRAEEAAKVRFVNESFGTSQLLKSLYGDDPERLAQEGIRVVREYAEKGGDPSELSNTEIAEYLERRELERYNSIKSRLELVGSEATQPAGGNVSLTQKDASTKSSRSKKAVSEMTADEARAEAIRKLEEES